MRPDNEDATEIEEYRRKMEILTEKANRVRKERDRLLEVKRRIQAIYYQFDCDEEES